MKHAVLYTGPGDTDKVVNSVGGGEAPAPQGVADNTASAFGPPG